VVKIFLVTLGLLWSVVYAVDRSLGNTYAADIDSLKSLIFFVGAFIIKAIEDKKCN
jgi:hypothetical protein